MQVIAATPEDGVYVEQNADNLSGQINASQATITVGTAAPFAAADVVSIDQERILLGTDVGDGSYTLCTRGYQSTTKAIHVTSSNVFKEDGETVLTYTFDGSTLLSAIRCGALERDAVFGLMVDGVLKYRRGMSAYGELDKDFEFRPWTPAAGTIVKVLCWTFADVNAHAVMES